VRWALVQDALVDIIGQQSGLPTYWWRRKSAWRARSFARLDMLGVRAIGVDEERLEYDPIADSYTQRRFGQRVFRVQIAVETKSQNLAESALSYAEAIRSRLRFVEVHRALNAVGLALSDMDEIQTQDYLDYEGRDISFAGFEARFNAFVIETGEDVDRVIEVTVDDENTATGPDIVIPP